MRRIASTALAALMPLWVAVAMAAEPEPVKFTKPPAVTTDGATTRITFAVSRQTDVEVAVVDAKGAVVRHLAAGVLGGKTAPPPLKPGLSQTIVWDGKDDYGQEVKGGPFRSRVRAGMDVKLDKIVGGDPYAFYSKMMGQGDHAAWRITGLEAKSDGKVYVLGNANNYGPPALRAYNADGSYLRTVYPPPAGMKPEEVKGWGIIEKKDGTYTFQYNDLASPALSRTPICGTRGRIANLFLSAGNDQLLISYGFRMMKIHTNGTIPAKPILAGRLINEPSLFEVVNKRPVRIVVGHLHTSMAADGRHFYVGGLFAGKFAGWRRKRTGAAKTGFWRDGQIFKVDLAARKASVFFALDERKVISGAKERLASPIADTRYGTYAALQGVAADAAGRVFVCDRQNERVVVLDANGKIIREIPVKYPDAIGVHPTSKALYVTTRYGHFHGRGKLTLLKFNDWSKDTKPTATEPLCGVSHFDQKTHLVVARSPSTKPGQAGEPFIWVAYTALPVRVFKDKGPGLELVRDFYRDSWQRALDLQHFVVDRRNERVYVADGFNNCFKLVDWEKPNFERLVNSAGQKIGALSMSIDARGRYLYCHQDRRPVVRYRIDGDKLTPDVPGGGKPAPSSDGSKRKPFVGGLTPRISNDWRIGLGQGDRGIGAAPDGSVVTMNAVGTHADYGGYLRFFRADPKKIPWGEGLLFKSFGTKVSAAGARFDVRGNLYAGMLGRGKSKGAIYKYAPTGSMGDLFPTEPKAPAKVYNVEYGYPVPKFSRTPRFAVDGYGRIYYPTSLTPKVSVIDNEGNPILSFGTWGNRDSMGGLDGDLVPTKDVPMAWPNSIDATDDYIYVSDIVNVRLLRLAKTFAATETVKVK